MLGVLAAAVLLAGCAGGAPSQERAISGVGDLVRLPGAAARTPAATVVPLELARPDGSRAPRLQAFLEGRGARAELAVARRSSDVVTWRTGDGVNVALVGPGVLLSTRGAGEDLIVADVSAVVGAVQAGRPAELRRVHRYFGGDKRLDSRSFDCSLRVVGRDSVEVAGRPVAALRMEERCSGTGTAAGTAFVNEYWRDARRPVLLRSRQWVGPDLGMIALDHPAG